MIDLEHLTRREYLLLNAFAAGAYILTAQEAVASVAIEHPEWDMDEVHSLDEWDEIMKGGE